MEDLNRQTFICDCKSLEHQYSFWYDKDENQVFFEPHLFISGNWFQRFWKRVKYLLGYKSRLGAFDELIIDNGDAQKIIDFLQEVVDKDIEKVVNRSIN